MLNSLIKQLIVLLSNLGDLMELLFRSPFRALQRYRGQSQHWLINLLLMPFVVATAIVSFIYQVLSSPLRSFRTLSLERQRNVLFALPALLALSVAGFVAFVVATRAQAIEANYRSKSNLAIANKEFDRAKVYLNRIMSNNSQPSQDDLFSLSLALSQTGEIERASSILAQLAPEDKIGFDKAHSLRALNLAQIIQESSDVAQLDSLRWHLENSEKNGSPEISQAWAMYFVRVQQPEDAIPHMLAASTINPSLLISAADIYKQSNNENAANRTLRQALSIFERQVNEKPTDVKARVNLAITYVKLDQLEIAEKLLLAGDQIQSTPEMRRAVCEFYVLSHDMAVAKRKSIEVQLKALQNAMRFDINYTPIYERLIVQYRRPGTENSENIKSILETAIAAGESTSLAHFAIGNLYWLNGENKKAEFHIEQSYRLDNRLAVVGNNLAWLLAHKLEPELDQAYSLASSVVEQVPDDPRFRDTLATVLMKQEQYNDALVEFEKALRDIRNKHPVHEKIAFIYDKLNNSNLSQLHKKLAKEELAKAKRLQNPDRN